MVFQIVFLPILALNIGAGIVGGIWLILLGEWRLIGIGVAIALSGHLTIPMLSTPVLVLAARAGRNIEVKNRVVAYSWRFLLQAWIDALLIGTCVLGFSICSRAYGDEISWDSIPYFLWSWIIAFGPWQMLVAGERGTEYVEISLLSGYVFYLLFLLSLVINPLMTFIVVCLFLITQLIVLPILSVVDLRQELG